VHTKVNVAGELNMQEKQWKSHYQGPGKMQCLADFPYTSYEKLTRKKILRAVHTKVDAGREQKKQAKQMKNILRGPAAKNTVSRFSLHVLRETYEKHIFG